MPSIPVCTQLCAGRKGEGRVPGALRPSDASAHARPARLRKRQPAGGLRSGFWRRAATTIAAP